MITAQRLRAIHAALSFLPHRDDAKTSFVSAQVCCRPPLTPAHT